MPGQISLRALAALAAAAWLTGCPPPPPAPSDGGTDAGVSISPVELCDRLSAARCNLLARCYPAFNRVEPSSCRALTQARCLEEYEGLRPSFESEAVEVDSEQVLSCEERMKTSTCAPTFPPGYASIAAHPFSDCELQTGLLRGKIPSGQTCERAIECVAGVACVKAGGTCRGTCSAFPKLGEACGFGCAPGLYCDSKGTLDGNDDRCASPQAAGKACESSQECAADLVCSAGVCTARGKLGEPCRFDYDRLTPCEPGLACDVVPFVDKQVGTCILPVGLGGACKFHWSCEPGLVCFDLDYTGFPASAPAQPGTCQLPGPVGSNCLPTVYSTYVGDQCGAGTYCGSSQKCTGTPSVGDSCTPSSQTCGGVRIYCKPSGSGDTGTCAGPPNQGERCAFPLDATRTVTIPCTSGWCDSETTLTCRAPNKALGALCTQAGECTSGRCAVQQDSSMRCAAACL